MMKLYESGEMYLETILVLSQQKPVVRAVDIAEKMGYSKPSVSRGLKILKNNEFIDIDRDGFITLTDSGRKLAEKIYERHNILTSFFVGLGVSEAAASEDACRIEHVISDETFEAIKNLK